MMTHVDRSRLATALVLILLGAWFMLWQLVPALQLWTFGANLWPLSVIGVGVVLLIVGLLTWTPGLMVPASIVGGIGAMLFWQNATGEWESWAYSWTLIPGFVGFGIFLSHVLRGNVPEGVKRGGWLMLVSGFLFLIFASAFGGPNLFGIYWPLLLIGLGLLMLGRSVWSALRPGGMR